MYGQFWISVVSGQVIDSKSIFPDMFIWSAYNALNLHFQMDSLTFLGSALHNIQNMASVKTVCIPLSGFESVIKRKCIYKITQTFTFFKCLYIVHIFSNAITPGILFTFTFNCVSFIIQNFNNLKEICLNKLSE